MAKAQFHKHQRVYVHPVGTWAAIEHVKPQWVRGVEEPVKIFYDCGLGRDFAADELAAEHVEDGDAGRWRLMRAKNKWQTPEECGHHPYPGTFPVVVTDDHDWGGWRVPAAEYDRDPARIEAQARLVTNAPRLLGLGERVAKLVAENPDAAPDMIEIAREFDKVSRAVRTRPEAPDNARSGERAEAAPDPEPREETFDAPPPPASG
ncbi:hypothetical protein [Marinicauda salina]|uniref:hypothetical protein n=1 Tax=Marinicauda salina TaxID=2135793 RepID=UPI001E326B96|nr:hypothetical protein [Marinicauda salina]